jgi:methyl-accepting chemotaxis protein
VKIVNVVKNGGRSTNTFRLHLALTVALVTLAFAAVIALALFAPLASQLSRPDLDPSVIGGIAEYTLAVHAGFWPVVLVCLVASVASGLLLHGRMTGPLPRFVRAFRGVARGELPPPITIRRVDYLRVESEALNEMLVALEQRARRIENALGEVDRIADELLAMPALGAEGTGLAEQLRDAVKSCR